MTTIEQIKHCTYMQCFECCSCHRMNYNGDGYECEECYREVKIEQAIDIQVDWKKFKKIVNKSKPKYNT